MTTPTLPTIFALAALVAVASLSACGEPQTEAEKTQLIAEYDVKMADRRAKAVNEDIKGYVDYTMDVRTGLCFVRSKIKSGYYVYSPVECTDSVKRLIVNPAK